MKFISATIAALAALILVAPVFTLAAEKSIGQREYEGKCVMCHGVTGKGDGWFSEYLKHRTSSLTQLKRNNGGVFPFDRVYQVIDGRKEVQVHGPREMPVWGGVYRVDSEKTYDSYFGQFYVDEGVIRARILALIEYISQLQE